MKCVVNWILLRIRVRSRNSPPHLQAKGTPRVCQGGLQPPHPWDTHYHQFQKFQTRNSTLRSRCNHRMRTVQVHAHRGEANLNLLNDFPSSWHQPCVSSMVFANADSHVDVTNSWVKAVTFQSAFPYKYLKFATHCDWWLVKREIVCLNQDTPSPFTVNDFQSLFTGKLGRVYTRL